MVDVAHDRDDRRPRQCFGRVVGRGFLLGEGLRVVELGCQRLVAHLLDDDHRRLLVHLLVDGDHLAQLHHLLDDLAGLHAHLVRKVGHADRLGHVHFLGHELRRRRVAGGTLGAAVAATTAARRAPARASAAVAARLQRRAPLGRIVGPARRELLGLDLLLVTWLGRAGRAPARRTHGLVNRAFQGLLDLRLWLFRLLGQGHLARLRHHRTDGRSLGFGGLAALFQIDLLEGVLVAVLAALDHAPQRGLGRGCSLGLRLHRRVLAGALAGALGLGGAGLFGLALRLRLRFGGSPGFGFGRFPGRALLFFTLPTALGQRLFLEPELLRLRFGFVFAPPQFGLGRGGFGNAVVLDRRVPALDEDALLAHLDLDRARLARRVRLLDLGGGLARQRDLLALAAAGSVGAAQELEQPLLVGVGQRVLGRLLGHASRCQLLDQRCGRALELLGKLCDGSDGHGSLFSLGATTGGGLRR